MSFQFTDPDGNLLQRFQETSNTFNLNDNGYTLLPSTTQLRLQQGSNIPTTDSVYIDGNAIGYGTMTIDHTVYTQYGRLILPTNATFYSHNLNIQYATINDISNTTVSSPNVIPIGVIYTFGLSLPMKLAYGKIIPYLPPTDTTTLIVFSLKLDSTALPEEKQYINASANTKLMLNIHFQGRTTTAGTASFDVVLRDYFGNDFTIDTITAVFTTINVDRYIYKSIVYTIPQQMYMFEIRITPVSPATFTTNTVSTKQLQIYHFI